MLFTSCRNNRKKNYFYIELTRLNMDDFFYIGGKKGAFFHSIDIYCSLPETVFSGEIAKS